ncbi:MAG: DUF4143 domain-containing protein [Coriobacteriales bacterium]|nr:DUF4143 domain-containing protein [Coriobacteriales bacterium]
MYQLADQFSLFFLSWMKGRQQGHDGYWSSGMGSGVRNSWAGYAFEQVCLAHVGQIKKARGISGILTSCSAWSGVDEDGNGAQVDLVIERNDNVIDLCEMKYSIDEYTLGADEDERLRHRRSAFISATHTRKAVHLILVTTYGLKLGKYSCTFQSVITMEDLFA